MRLAVIFKWNELDGRSAQDKLSHPDRKDAMSKPKVCSNCGGGEIEYDAGRGDAVCTSCGSVLEEDIIVSEVSFQEQSSGASSVVGQFVSSEGGKAPLSGTGFHHGMGKDSREVTLQQAKRRLTQLGNMLKLNQHCIDTAFMFFKMALQLNLTRGRKSSIVDTACLYLVCRSEGTPHLLLDFSDVLQINVYALGRAYLKLSNALHINPPAIDPCLYIHRFAHKLELGDKTHEVSMTALRLVARMKRDWIHHGRRPAGLCGAALLVSARVHNFNRSVKEVARVVKLSDGTIRKRLGDFRDTPSSRLTIDEFLKIDLEQEHDPPSFTEAKKRAKHHQVAGEADQSKADKEGDSTDSEDDLQLEGEGGGGGGGGFGGIRMSSVQEVIAKARFDEAFNIAPTVGLSNDLEELAKLVDEEQQEEEGKSPLELENSKEGELSLEDIDDQEIDNMLLSEEEVKIKTQLWFAENADFLKEQEERRQRLAAIKAAKGDKPKRRVNRRKQKAHYQPASTAGEAIERMLVEKRISSKINYDVLRDLDKGLSSNGSTIAGASTTMPQADEALTRESSLTGLSSSACVVPPVTTGDASPLTIKRSPSSGSSARLPSLSTRKRTFTSLSGLPAHGTQPTRKFSRTNSPLDSKPPIPVPETDSILQESSERQRTASPSNQRTTLPLGRTEDVDSQPSMIFGLTGSGDGILPDVNPPMKDVIEESGPVQYCEEDVEEEGLDDEDLDELAYEGDPLLDSDYEEEAGEQYYEDYDNN